MVTGSPSGLGMRQKTDQRKPVAKKWKEAKKVTVGIPYDGGLPETGGDAGKMMVQLYPFDTKWMMMVLLDGAIPDQVSPWRIGVVWPSVNTARPVPACGIKKESSQLKINDIPFAITPLSWAVPAPPRPGHNYCRPSARGAKAAHSGPV